MLEAQIYPNKSLWGMKLEEVGVQPIEWGRTTEYIY